MTIFSQVTNLHLYTNNLSYQESDYTNNNKHIRHIYLSRTGRYFTFV